MEERIKLLQAALRMQGEHWSYQQIKRIVLTSDAVKQLKAKFSIEDATHINSLIEAEQKETEVKFR
jgi:hypothetical protein